MGAQTDSGAGFLGGINAGLPAYGLATGTNFVPYDNFPALLHRGEAVVPAKYNPASGGTPNRGTAPVVNLTYNIAPGTTRAELLQAMQMTREQTKADVLDSMRRAGAFAR